MIVRILVIGTLVVGVLGPMEIRPSFGEEVLSSNTKIVKGEILQIEGPYYKVKDRSGSEIRLHVDKNTTMMDGGVQVGDHIVADVTPQGHAAFIIKGSPGAPQQLGSPTEPSHP